MKKNETGRSMVEMLGVLAIIGVLSVAGIAGYTMAMKKYKANEAANAISMAVILAKTANQGDGADANWDATTNGGLTMPSGVDSIVLTAKSGDVYHMTVTVDGVDCDALNKTVPTAAGAAANAAGYYVTCTDA